MTNLLMLDQARSRSGSGGSIRLRWIVMLILAVAQVGCDGGQLLPTSLGSRLSTASSPFQLSGRVTDGTGAAIAGASVTVIDPGSGSSVGSATTAASGEYVVSVAGGTYNVRVTPPAGSGFGESTIFGVVVSSNTILNIVLVPSGSGRFSGTLRDREGNPVPNQLVRLMGPSEHSVTTAADGSFSLTVAPNTYSLGVRRNGTAAGANIPDNFDLFGPSIALSGDRRQDLTLANVYLTVTVRDPAGNPVSGAGVSVGCTSTNFELFPGGRTSGGVCGGATTDGSGTARLTLLPAGSVGLTVTPPASTGLAPATVGGISLTSDASVTVTVAPPSRFSGTLRDRDGTPVPNQLVRLMGPVERNVITGADGSFAISAAPGAYTLGVRRSGSGGAAQIPDNFDLFGPSITLTSDRAQDLTLQNVMLSVRVVDPAGNPVSGAGVSVGCTSTSFELFPGGRTSGGVCGGASADASGTANVILLPARSVGLSVTPPAGSGLSAVSVGGIDVSSDATVTVTLVAPTRFSGTLRDRDGTPVPNQLVRLMGPVERNVITGADGSFAISAAPGAYTLGVRRSGSGGAAQIPDNFDLFGPSITLTSDRAQDLTLQNVVISVTVRDPSGNPVPNTTMSVGCTSTSFELFPGGRTSGGVCGGASADASGVARLILFPAGSISITATPPEGSGLLRTVASGIRVTADAGVVIVMQSPNSPPVANASGPYSGIEGSAVTFNGGGSSDPDGDALTYAWDFGDGNTGTGASPSHTYADDGTYTVTLTVADPSGASHRAATTATIANVKPSVNAGSDVTISSGQTFAFSGSFTDPGADSPWSYSVQWGTGSPSTGTAAAPGALTEVFQYLKAGTYAVTLSVTDKDGARGSDALTVVVKRLPVSVDIKPGSSENPVNLKEKGNLPVAVLTTPDFDAKLVDVASVRFGPNGATEAHAKGHYEDVDKDGDVDLVLHFDARAIGLTASTTDLALTGDLSDGRQIEGSDVVRIVP
jgi:PKD repeat protein